MAYRPPWKKQPAPQQAELPNPASQQRTEQPDPVIQQATQSSSAPRQEAAQTNPAPRQEAAQHTTAQHQNQHGSRFHDSNGYVPRKVGNYHGRGKAIDFNTKLIPASDADFAMIHGSGGKNHATNSSMEVKVCNHGRDQSGKKFSRTAYFNIDVHDFDYIYTAAMERITHIRELIHPNNPMRIQPGEIIHIYPEKEGVMQKVVPARGKPGMGFVSMIDINYMPVQPDGTISEYPWYINIQNFIAPIVNKKNGAINYKGKEATEKIHTEFNMSNHDFSNAMARIMHHVNKWEIVGNNKQFLAGYNELYRR